MPPKNKKNSIQKATEVKQSTNFDQQDAMTSIRTS